MRKKLIALSIALLAIGGLVTSTTAARADVPSGIAVLASICAGDNALLFYSGKAATPFAKVDQYLSVVADAEIQGSHLLPNIQVGAIEFNSECGREGGPYAFSDAYFSTLTPTGIVDQEFMDAFLSDYGTPYSEDLYFIDIGVTQYQFINSGLSGPQWTNGPDIGVVQFTDEPTPALTLPPDFLTPKTYGNPASVTGTAPAAPAVALTPTAPVITAGATSVIYNGVPQSAPYSVDQKSSCSTTYNGSAIAPVQAGTYAVSITCSANSLSSTATTTLTITKAAPVISWSTPGAITSTTKLGASQLNAFSYIPGSFTYSASAGSSLPQGDVLVTATFTPTDSTNYTSATMTVTIHVTP